MQTSEQINELAGALAKAQSAIGTAKKDATNPHFKSAYATLASAWAAWQEVGPACGLAVIQSVNDEPDYSTVSTRLVHSSGQWIESTIRLKVDRDNMQAMGSSITYARRYSLMAMVGLAPSDSTEDDGNAATAAPAKKRLSAGEMKRKGHWDRVTERVDRFDNKADLKAYMQELKPELEIWPIAFVDSLRDYCEAKMTAIDTAKSEAEHTAAIAEQLGDEPEELENPLRG